MAEQAAPTPPPAKAQVLNDRTYQEVEYLKKNLGPILVAALAEICIRRPADPIEYLGHWLLRWRYNEELKRRDVQNALEVVRQKAWSKDDGTIQPPEGLLPGANAAAGSLEANVIEQPPGEDLAVAVDVTTEKRASGEERRPSGEEKRGSQNAGGSGEIKRLSGEVQPEEVRRGSKGSEGKGASGEAKKEASGELAAEAPLPEEKKSGGAAEEPQDAAPPQEEAPPAEEAPAPEPAPEGEAPPE